MIRLREGEKVKQNEIVNGNTEVLMGKMKERENKPVSQDAKDWTTNFNLNASNNPPSFWATHKLFSEQYLEYFSQNHNIKSLSLRLSNVYGPINRINVLNKMVLNKIIYLA